MYGKGSLPLAHTACLSFFRECLTLVLASNASIPRRTEPGYGLKTEISHDSHNSVPNLYSVGFVFGGGLTYIRVLTKSLSSLMHESLTEAFVWNY